MAVAFKISDNLTDRTAGVTTGGALKVAVEIPDVPNIGQKNKYRYLRGYLGSTGMDSGTTNMNVNGSVTSQKFYCASEYSYDIYINHITIIIADGAVAHNTFGDIAALTNGFSLYVEESGEITYFIQNAKTGGQVIAQAGFYSGYGSALDSWELGNWTGTSDAQTITLPINNYIPGGIRIGRQSNDKIVAIVNDNLTGLTEFWVTLFGYKHYPGGMSNAIME